MGHRHTDAVGDLGQQPHRGEFGGADAEGDDSQGQQSQRHGAGEPFNASSAGTRERRTAEVVQIPRPAASSTIALRTPKQGKPINSAAAAGGRAFQDRAVA
ncbi:hypothetical protein GCM10010276_21030 [Streptomyces longisporus]|uniref:Uncharacterized protein n=1 Tax=Streptomyces longisporus TaxID=1948 RepID=A0ABP5YT73_STRLO